MKWTVDTGRMTMTFYDKAGTRYWSGRSANSVFNYGTDGLRNRQVAHSRPVLA
jgi:hypothetical protein